MIGQLPPWGEEWDAFVNGPGSQSFIRRKSGRMQYEVCDGSGAVVGTIKVRGLSATLSTTRSTYKTRPFHSELRDITSGGVVFKFGKQFGLPRLDRLVVADDSTLNARFKGRRAKNTIMELVDGVGSIIAVFRWLPPVSKVRGFPMGEAVFSSGPIPGVDPVVTVTMGFGSLQSRFSGGVGG